MPVTNATLPPEGSFTQHFHLSPSVNRIIVPTFRKLASGHLERVRNSQSVGKLSNIVPVHGVPDSDPHDEALPPGFWSGNDAHPFFRQLESPKCP